jgi:hypothetical protein
VDGDTGIVGRLRRSPAKPISESGRQDWFERTVFVTGFPRSGVTQDDIVYYFENNFDQVSLIKTVSFRPKFTDKLGYF